MPRLSLRSLLVATSAMAPLAGTGTAAMAAPTRATVSTQANMSTQGEIHVFAITTGAG